MYDPPKGHEALFGPALPCGVLAAQLDGPILVRMPLWRYVRVGWMCHKATYLNIVAFLLFFSLSFLLLCFCAGLRRPMSLVRLAVHERRQNLRPKLRLRADAVT